MLVAFLLIFVFLAGASIGSFLNVSIARLPLEKSVLWPSSRCGSCLQPIHWYDNIPILSYLWLRGRCRACGQSFSVVYLLVELGTALAFIGLFWLEVVVNVHGWPAFPGSLISIVGFTWHAVLLAFLIIASVCDLKSREIPLSLTLTGTLVGVIGSALMPWPWPHVVPPLPPGFRWQDITLPLQQGTYAWPFWGPLPSWAREGEWQTGLLTGVIGALVGTFLLRGVSFLFSKGLGKEALGIGDADLMMMAGAFMGWQIVVVAFFLSVFPALFFGIIQLIVRRDNASPFGPSLAMTVMAVSLAWNRIGPYVRPAFFWGAVLFWAVILGAGILFLTSFALRLLRRQEGPQS
jgi:leader peptidase (prepilin peptidase) / N-methyltransferase